MGNSVPVAQILAALKARMGGGQPPFPNTPPTFPSTSTPPSPSVASGAGPTPPVPGAQPGPSQPSPNAPMASAAPQIAFPKPAPRTNIRGSGLPGMIMALVNKKEQDSYNHKVALAETYATQINQLLASGLPEDRKKAEDVLNDPKVRKILKDGLDYTPIEETPPPEAIGVNRAMQKHGVGKGQQQAPPGRVYIPGPSQEAQMAQKLAEAKIGAEQSTVQRNVAEAAKFGSEASAAVTKADAEVLARQKEALAAQKTLEEAELKMKSQPLLDEKTKAETKKELALARKADADAQKALKEAGQTKLQAQWKDTQGGMKDLLANSRDEMRRLQSQAQAGRSYWKKAMGGAPQATSEMTAANAKFMGFRNAYSNLLDMQDDVLGGKITPEQARIKSLAKAGVDTSGDPTKWLVGPSGDYVMLDPSDTAGIQAKVAQGYKEP